MGRGMRSRVLRRCGGGEEEGGMSGGGGMERLGSSECTAERAGHGSVAVVTIRNHMGNYMRSDKPSLRHSHNTMGRCYCDHPCFRNRHRGTERLSNLLGSVQASKPRCPDAQPTTQTEGAPGPGARVAARSRSPGTAPFGLESRRSRLPRPCRHEL